MNMFTPKPSGHCLGYLLDEFSTKCFIGLLFPYINPYFRTLDLLQMEQSHNVFTGSRLHPGIY